MTQPNSNPWDLGGGGESFPFDNLGDEVEGFVQDMMDRQATDMQTQEPDWWDEAKTRPKMLTIVTLQTNLRENPKDDGLRGITLSGSKKPFPDGGLSRMAAAYKAIRSATGGTEFQFNAWFKMKWVAEGPRTRPGFNPPKYYEAWYRPPVMDLDGANRTAPANEIPQTYAEPQAAAQPAGQTYGPGGGPQPGANPSSAPAQGAPNNLAGATITAAQIEGLKAAGVDPALVYGADWHTRVVP